MNKLIVSAEAARDLENIRTYISHELHNRISANRIIRSITQELRILQHYAEAGPSVEALTGFPTDLRVLVCGKHIALYRVNGNCVYVARILNAKQDYLQILEKDESGYLQ